MLYDLYSLRKACHQAETDPLEVLPSTFEFGYLYRTFSKQLVPHLVTLYNTFLWEIPF